MEQKGNKSFLRSIIPVVIALVLLGGFLAYGFMRISELTKNVSSLSVELADTNAKLRQNTSQLSAELASTTATLSQNTNQLSQKLRTCARKPSDFPIRFPTPSKTLMPLKRKLGALRKPSVPFPALSAFFKNYRK